MKEQEIIDQPPIVNVVIPPLEGGFSYQVPKHLLGVVDVGVEVEVPFGNRITNGFVTEIWRDPREADWTPDIILKEIKAARSIPPSFPKTLLPFFEWIARYYTAPLSQVIETAVPKLTEVEGETRVLLNPEGEIGGRAGKRQREILELLDSRREGASLSELKRRFPRAAQTVERLSELSLVTLQRLPISSESLHTQEAPEWAPRTITLSEAQQRVVNLTKERLRGASPAVVLLHGGTGSGKTEVYIEAVQSARENGRGALILVPEIALTPQLIDRFRARLGNNIALLHSQLSLRERSIAWRSLLEGNTQIAIGARSALFAPVKDLGCIIVDEEHDSSFKQSDHLRYHGRDLALVRSQLENCVTILGSATPSMETYYNAAQRKFQYQVLPARAAAYAATEIEIVDLNRVKSKEMPSPHISPRLFEVLQSAFARGEQAFLLYNRRGFASFLQCSSCREVVSCPNCSVTLTFHRSRNILSCHHCGFQSARPSGCQQCSEEISETTRTVFAEDSDGPARWLERGAGTERIFEEVQQLFPSLSVDRLDRDAVRRVQDMQLTLDRFRRGETQLLCGTQMLAKGHDLPGVTAVGVIDCDVGLHFPDFRGSERTFHLLVQMAGRAGRREKKGSVVLQTRCPEHPVLRFAKERDYKSFAKYELSQRRALRYPPFSRLVRIVASATDPSAPIQLLRELNQFLCAWILSEDFGVQILGPSPAPIEKVKSRYRAHLILKGEKIRELHLTVRALKTKRIPKSIRLTYDFDPQDML